MAWIVEIVSVKSAQLGAVERANDAVVPEDPVGAHDSGAQEDRCGQRQRPKDGVGVVVVVSISIVEGDDDGVVRYRALFDGLYRLG